ncbi:MAG: hypothetical protein KKG04_02310 [Candidatus Thermoplasmatota archaeon]|nr:hypothetical protein [Candidatus Thermoplasmatota archaeon]
MSGCQEELQGSISATDKVTLQSNIVEFSNVSFIKLKNRAGLIYQVDFSWLFHNIANREIDVGIEILFYDSLDQLIYNETKEILDMPAGWTEHYSPFNTVKLLGNLAQQVDYVKVVAVEI